MPERSKDRLKNNLSILMLLVAMIFAILFASVVISGVVSYILFFWNIIPSVPENRHILAIAYMVMVSLFTGAVLARVLGKRFLRQIYELTEATKEVAAGNFNIRMKAGNIREVSIIAMSFNNMVKELSHIETLRSDFVDNISHEFKTPVSSIRGFARLLKKDTLTAEQRNEYLDIIISESERLTRLSGNVLLLSRFENTDKAAAGAEYSLDEQIRRTVLLMEPQLNKKHLDVDVDLEEVLYTADEEMLSHLWINLLGNAIKFSSDFGIIKISLVNAGGIAVATVSDAGAGMDDEVKERIFDKFYQGDKSRATEGNGLGLSLVKRILELAGGKINVESEPGKGTVFTVSLPLR